jgi:hypothetical protein
MKMGKATVMEGEGAAEGLAELEEAEVQEGLIDWKSLWKPMSLIVGVFLLFFWLPIDNSRFAGAVIESLALVKWYAREHVLLCLVQLFSLPAPFPVLCPRRL